MATTSPFAALRTLGRGLASAWRHAEARREFAQLDAHALRDLGLATGEFDSWWAESLGCAERTRNRVSEDAWR